MSTGRLSMVRLGRMNYRLAGNIERLEVSGLVPGGQPARCMSMRSATRGRA